MEIFKKKPFKFEHLNMRKSSLFVGVKERREEFDFDNNLYATAFINLMRAIGNEHIHFKRKQYEHNNFMLHYNLAPDCSSENLSPIQVENVRLEIQLKAPLDDSYTCIIMTETPHVLEIAADRSIQVK
jgi:hypothetical protein